MAPRLRDPSLPAEHPVHALASRVAAAGGRLLVVGGWVRDQLLGRPAKDLDLEVLGLDEAVLGRVLGTGEGATRVGRAFPVWLLPRVPAELSLAEPHARSDFREAARRRDLTCNAIGWDPRTGELLDPWHGRRDLEAGRLRATDPGRFGEDRVRVLRVARLRAVLGLEPEAELARLAASLSFDGLPAERVFEELRQLLVAGRRPSAGLQWLRAVGWLGLWPELEALVGVPQDPRWHPEGDVWIHTALALDAAAGLRSGDAEDDAALAWAVLCHDLGKPAATRRDADGRVRALGHETAGVAPTDALLLRLRAPGALVERVVALVRHHLEPARFGSAKAPAGPRGYRRLARTLAAAHASLALLERVARADHLGRTTDDARRGRFPAGDRFLAAARRVGVSQRAPATLVRGRDVVARGIRPGPEVGAVLARCRAIQDETGWLDGDRVLERALREHLHARHD